MKTYRMNEMGGGLKSAPRLIVNLTVGGTIISGVAVADIGHELHARNLANAWPISAHTQDGVGVPLFPVIKPLTGKAAWGLKKIVGYEVPVGDGLSCGYQGKADRHLTSLHNLGVELDELETEWMVAPNSKGAPAQAFTQPERNLQPQPKFTEEQYLAGLADNPF